MANICSMRRLMYHWPSVQAYFDAGHGFVECQKRFGFSHTAWIKAIQRVKLRIPKPDHPFADRRRKYDWAAVQAYYDQGHTYRQCKAHFGFEAASWTKAVRRGELKARARAWPLDAVLNKAKNRSTVKRRLLEAGILSNRCEWCGITEWRGRPISIQIDHVNGIHDDHRLENLRMLCPNCHSQTDTHGARNKQRRRSFPSSSTGRAPDSESGGSSFDPKLGSHGPIV